MTHLTSSSTKAAAPLVLDPALLGRPVHRLPQFAAQLRDDLAVALRQGANRRYWGAFAVEAVDVARLDGNERRTRWLHFTGAGGVLAFSLERKVLLQVLNNRYGRGKGSEPAVDEALVKVTATEERLAVVLGQQIAAAVAHRIAEDVPRGDAVAAQPVEAVTAPNPARGAWVVVITVREGDVDGKLWVVLDKHLMSDVLRGLASERESVKRAPAAPLAQRMQVALDGRLVSKEVTLGALFDLRVGDVIPVSLHRADVMLEDSRLFTAAVTEHKGKLCLTSFEDIE